MEENVNISLLDRFMKGETSAQEDQQLLNWFRCDRSREEILDFYRGRWEEAKEGELSDEAAERMLARIKSRMQTLEQPRRLWLGNWWKYAVAAILIIGVGLTSHVFTLRSMTMDKKHYVVEAAKGQRAGVTLPDGTKVWLNSHTEIKYSSDYGNKERVVLLSGEAYFDVAKDKAHRFVVKAGGLEVEALGTAFNVQAYEEDEEVTATLFSGSLRATAGNNFVVLSPDQQVQYRSHSKQLEVKRQGNFAYARMWRDNELAFNGETLDEVAQILNRMYNVRIIFESEKIKQYGFCGVIKNNSLDNVIEIISLTAPITYKSQGDSIILSEKH